MINGMFDLYYFVCFLCLLPPYAALYAPFRSLFPLSSFPLSALLQVSCLPFPKPLSQGIVA